MINYLLLSLAVILAVRFALWYRLWKSHAAKFVNSGYTPPKPGFFAALFFAGICRLVTFLTVGNVKVIRSANIPKSGRAIFAANHQIPCDFAMLRRGSGRHVRMLTASTELTGNMGLMGAWFGSISVAFGGKGDGAAAEAACVNAVAEPNGALGIFPQGALLPDNILKKDEFRPGCVRMAKNASALAGDDVDIVPVAIHYKRDAASADWTHRILRKYRSMFPGTRNPRHWNPIFKLDVEALPADEKEKVLAEQKEAMRVYKKTRATNYGGVVVVGDPIKASSLPEDPLAAIEVVRLKIAELLEIAQRS